MQQPVTPVLFGVDGTSTMSKAQACCCKNSWAVAFCALHCLQTVMEQAGFTAHPLIFFLLYLNFTYLPPFALPGLDFPSFPPLQECLPSAEQAVSRTSLLPFLTLPAVPAALSPHRLPFSSFCSYYTQQQQTKPSPHARAAKQPTTATRQVPEATQQTQGWS